MEEKPLIIPIDQIKADFDKFLTPEHNRRIIFSGPFGIGKTYFLHEFFDAKEEYFPVFLRPINYSLLSNEDIFRFIKYDILCQLVENENFDIEKSFDFTGFDYTKLFLGQNGFAILFNLLKYMPKIGTYVKASQKLGVLVEKFQEGLKSFNENKELKLLKDFGDQTENHFLFENDGVTEFISQQLKKIVSQQSGGEQRKKVLIIDDLDRLDPEHIFRLFNVFSAHFDQVHYYENANANDNKFGFDKIVFVCDIENIRKIFAHKYGSEVDFSGYIDKFYSTEIFFLYHRNTFENSIKPFFDRKYRFYWDKSNIIDVSDLFLSVLELLYCGNNLNVREIIKLINFYPSFLTENKIIGYKPVFLTKMGAKENSVLKSYKLLIVIKMLEEVLGGKEELSRRIKKAYLSYSVNYQSYLYHQYNQILPDVLLFCAFEDHKFSQKLSEESHPIPQIFKTIEGKEINYIIEMGYYSGYVDEGEMWFRVRQLNGLIKLTSAEFFNILVKSISNVVESGLLD